MFSVEAKKSGQKWSVASAGVTAGRGYPASPVISYVMFQRKVPLTDHRSQPVEAKLLKKFHWIITMERSQRDLILKLNPSVADRIFVFRELTYTAPLERPDMPDPTGKEPDDYRELLDILNAEIPILFRRLESRISDVELGVE